MVLCTVPMSNYDLDFEINYAIKNGHHQFNEIWRKSNFKGSKLTFSNHLSQLVKAGFIRKDFDEKGKPRYYSGNSTILYESDKGLIGMLNKKISTINKNSKKVPDKELLKEFVDDTQDLLIVLSQIHFGQLGILNSYKESKNEFAKPDIAINEKKIELINKLISMRINILEKRDPELFATFFQLIQNNLQNFLTQNTKK
ncbi:MAG: hypothetical protein ISR79_00380 [Nitrosopumilus sp.]|nr:hypothetical protein [Nitrosopumilus sp.]